MYFVLFQVLNGEIIGRVNEHNHAPNRTEIEVKKVKTAMKRRAETTLDDPNVIFADCLIQSSRVESVAVNMPSIKHVKRTIRR